MCRNALSQKNTVCNKRQKCPFTFRRNSNITAGEKYKQ